MSSDPVISLENVSKIYMAYNHPARRIISRLINLKIGKQKEFHALNDININIRKGEAVGIIGRNGSGKSTLLQIICGILKPTTGTVKVNGSISALLELGSGFQPEFTGRENIFLQGSIIGFSREEMEDRFDKIAAFADIGEYLDQPVKTYSSGMFVRLAFAIAVAVEPDILVVDEALAVGDALFQKRCYNKIIRMKEDGLTLIFVSHDHETIRTLTKRTLFLEKGWPNFWGDTKEATHRYRKMLFEQEAVELSNHVPDATKPQSRIDIEEGSVYGIGGARIIDLRILDPDGRPRTVFKPGERINLEIVVLIETPLDHINIAVVIKTIQGSKVYSWGTFNQDIFLWTTGTDDNIFWNRSFQKGEEIIGIISLEGNLGAGDYEVQAIVSKELKKYYGAQQILHWRDEIGFFKVEMNPREYIFGGLCDLHGVAHFNG